MILRQGREPYGPPHSESATIALAGFGALGQLHRMGVDRLEVTEEQAREALRRLRKIDTKLGQGEFHDRLEAHDWDRLHRAVLRIARDLADTPYEDVPYEDF